MKRVLIAILLSAFLSSCGNFLNVEPENAVTFTNYFKNEGEIEALYINMLAVECGMLAPHKPTIHEIMGQYCDEMYMANPRLSGNVAEGICNLDPGYLLNEVMDDDISWRGYYDMIYLASMMVDNEYRFQDITAERKEFWLAQAWFVKALAYFHIARIWGDAPIVIGSESKDPLKKSPAKEVLEEALRCAEKALVLPLYGSSEMVNAKGTLISSRQYASKGTVYTLMANIYAWMGGLYGDAQYWTQAEACASKVIGGEAGVYGLEPIGTLCTNVMGAARKSNEIIFAIEINSIDRDYFSETASWNYYPGHWLLTYPVVKSDSSAKNDVVTQYAALNGYVDARIRYQTVKSLYPELKDERRKEFWYKLGEEENNPDDTAGRYSYIYKWRTPIISVNEETGKPFLGVEGNKVIWRLADLILLRGECRARLGLPSAAEDLNAVRRRAGLGDYAGTDDIRQEIFRERERELFGEGQRYYDAVRNGYLSDLSPVLGALSATDILRGAIYLPVCEKAFDNNSLMRQNIYWAWKK